MKPCCRDCKYFEYNTQNESQLRINDFVKIKSIEGKLTYDNILNLVGKIVFIDKQEYNGKIKYIYKVRVKDHDNIFQDEGLYCFSNIKSLELIKHPGVQTRVTIINDPLINKKEGKTMDTNNILKQWYNKQIYKLEQNKNCSLETIRNDSLAGKLLNEYIEKLRKIFIQPNQKMISDLKAQIWNDGMLTDKDLEKFQTTIEHYNINLETARQRMTNCELLLNMCETFEQKIDVLQKYNIIDNNYQIIE